MLLGSRPIHQKIALLLNDKVVTHAKCLEVLYVLRGVFALRVMRMNDRYHIIFEVIVVVNLVDLLRRATRFHENKIKVWLIVGKASRDAGE